MLGLVKNQHDKQTDGTHHEVSVEIGTAEGKETVRIGFTGQRLTAYGGMIVWSQFLKKKSFRERLMEALPHNPTSPNAYAPADIGLGFIGGVLCGADKLSRVAWMAQDVAVSNVLGIEAVPSQSTLSRFFASFSQKTNDGLNGLNRWVAKQWPSAGREGYTLDLDSWALLHEDGHQEGVKTGYTRVGLKPCLRPVVGVNMYHVKDLLGHESLNTLKHYARLTIVDLKKTHAKCHPREKDVWERGLLDGGEGNQ